ncbi:MULTISPECIES: aldehyde dehydrogenase [Streptomyces]|uniref:Aldehyde dehydrogenase n=1 Tax=Streptomyces tsukubensis (strain DSM 42081 / NBRC 108919 / NRRL 18488 / 9993) TaxID=1114943 RepID=I2MXL1_STRT9|nr:MULTISPECIES: aldehyde dehydrogenase [Streptomyces]AZK93876.1 aldehyde dehydrogenase [Streptomyces tsukubensis]EIF89508.1 aldehyde dehydrogenase [Streptomyces tsukubensis NRRL18488]MYS64289.1 aldehyde dehydrogenase family protein [Streptomyces sp. SID5473]QKM69995.1 aldehyde dehydrogenase [Streptomyces tsukubensis NRRL18488]TAI46027.1 aldehyde dehydrogenase [Streptomyces tsukubensis]
MTEPTEPTEFTAHEQLFIGGAWTDPLGTDTIDVVSPHTEQVIGRVPHASPADADRAVAAARRAFDEGPWPRMALEERIAVIGRIKDAIAVRHEEFARVISAQNGSPYAWSVLAQALGAMMVWDSAITVARAVAEEEPRAGVLGPILVRREPVGVVAAIVPWNVPQFTAAAKLAPALLAGCTAVLKPSPETPLDSYLLAEIVREAGLPEGVLSILPAGRGTGEYLVGHPGVDKVSFTGSVAAGRRVMEVAARNLTRVTLELGGKSAAVILPDADISEAVAGIAPAAWMNNGQACVAQTRILAPRARYAETAEALTAAAEALTVGDPLDPATGLGPLVAERQRRRSLDYIGAGRSEGARILTGGGRPKGLERGWYVEPTLLGDVDNGMRVAREEIFGPVVCLLPYGDEEEAVRIANDSDYGLSGSVWTADPERGIAFARRIRTGTYNVNTFSLDMLGPFGGYKNSGLGREFGTEGYAAYLEHKTIHLPAGYGS